MNTYKMVLGRSFGYNKRRRPYFRFKESNSKMSLVEISLRIFNNTCSVIL